MPDFVLNAEPRTVLGKKVARLRRQGITPANIYGHNVPSQAIQIPTPDVTRALRTVGKTHLVQLSLSGEPAPRMVLVRSVTRKPTNDLLLHIDFYQVSMTEKTNVSVPLILIGTSPIVDVGDGVLVHNLNTLHVECLPGDIPDHIEVDVSALTEVHAAIHVSDLPLPASVTPLDDPTMLVAIVMPKAVAEELTEAEAAAAEEAAAEAETEAAEAPAEGSAESEQSTSS